MEATKFQDEFEDINCRMFTLKHSLNFFIFCLNNGEFSDFPISMISFAYLIEEYFNNTKELYNNLQDKLGIER